jgi:hypothetical protein
LPTNGDIYGIEKIDNSMNGRQYVVALCRVMRPFRDLPYVSYPGILDPTDTQHVNKPTYSARRTIERQKQPLHTSDPNLIPHSCFSCGVFTFLRVSLLIKKKRLLQPQP